MKTRDDDYNFLRIADAVISINKKVNLIGIVIETSLPQNTQGTDYFCSVRIIDESRQSFGIFVHFFAGSMDKLPPVYSVGDILLVTRVMVTGKFKSVVRVVAMLPCAADNNSVIYRVRLTLEDPIAKIHALLYKDDGLNYSRMTIGQYSSHQIILIVGMGGIDDSFPLKEINEGKGSNLLCKILHVHEAQKDLWMLLVWDGTDVPHVLVETSMYFIRSFETQIEFFGNDHWTTFELLNHPMVGTSGIDFDSRIADAVCATKDMIETHVDNYRAEKIAILSFPCMYGESNGRNEFTIEELMEVEASMRFQHMQLKTAPLSSSIPFHGGYSRTS